VLLQMFDGLHQAFDQLRRVALGSVERLGR
jgi:hypothetical protein